MKAIKITILLVQTTALFGQYQYYQSDTLTSINTTNWWNNGNPSFTSQGLSAQGNAALLSNLAVPDGSNDYEVKTTVAFGDNSQGDLVAVAYLRVQGNPLEENAIQYYSVETDVSSSTGSCSYSLYKHYTDSGGPHTIFFAQGGGACHNGSVLRSVVVTLSNIDSIFQIYIDDQLVGSIFDVTGVTYGAPGLGIKNGCLSGCGGLISRVDIGPRDRIAPNAVNPATIGTSVWANRMDAQ